MILVGAVLGGVSPDTTVQRVSGWETLKLANRVESVPSSGRGVDAFALNYIDGIGKLISNAAEICWSAVTDMVSKVDAYLRTIEPGTPAWSRRPGLQRLRVVI